MAKCKQCYMEQELCVCDKPRYNGPRYGVGWVCPKCGRALAPWAYSCNCNVRYEVTHVIPEWTIKVIANDGS